MRYHPFLVLFLIAFTFVIISKYSEYSITYPFRHYSFSVEKNDQNYIPNESTKEFHFYFDFNSSIGKFRFKGSPTETEYMVIRTSFPLNITNSKIIGDNGIVYPNFYPDITENVYNFSLQNPIKEEYLEFEFTSNIYPHGSYHFSSYSNNNEWDINFTGKFKCSDFCFQPYNSRLLSIKENQNLMEFIITDLDNRDGSFINFLINTIDPQKELIKSILFGISMGLIILLIGQIFEYMTQVCKGKIKSNVKK